MIVEFFRKKSVQKEGPNDSIDERLNKHPLLKTRVETLLDVIENVENNVEKANIAEQKVRDEVRQIGQQALQDWAETYSCQVAEEFQNVHPEVKKHGKKDLYWYTTFGTIKVKEQLYLQNGLQKRPFSQKAEVKCRGYSLPLQRVITDFGADNAFGKSNKKLIEHYGISLPTSSIQAITEKHALKIEEEQELLEKIPKDGQHEIIVAEMDGSLVPVVETETGDNPDRRKNRSVSWKEARLCLAHPIGSCTPVFGGTIDTPQQVGKHLLHTAICAGLNQNSCIHAVGDGAPWIANQVNEISVQTDYLVDFYHLCDYLAAAAKVCAPQHSQTWLNLQKKRMKNSGLPEVLLELKPFLEPANVADENAPVRCCYRYLQNRPGQFNYQAAREAGLPIGSGEIESSHRYIIQERIKLSGAWWRIDNAKSMLALRLQRANDQWQEYWENLMPQPA